MAPSRAIPIALAAALAATAARAFCAEIRLEGGRAPEWVQLFPAGPELKASDGRRWRLSDHGSVTRRSDERRGGRDLPVDWEHAQDRRAPLGERADAAAWIKEFAVRDGALAARVEWTEAGRASVEGRYYRYISPSFGHTVEIGPRGNLDGGDVTYVAGAGLVNRPAFDMPALAGEEGSVNEFLKKVLEALSLASDAGEDKALEAIAALKTERDEARSQAAADPPADRFVPREMYSSALARATAAESELAEQAQASLEGDIKRELDAAQEAGKVTPATRSWFESQCRKDGGLEEVRKLLAIAPATGEPSGVSGGPPEGSGGFASAEERSIAGIFGREAKFLDEHAPSQGAS